MSRPDEEKKPSATRLKDFLKTPGLLIERKQDDIFKQTFPNDLVCYDIKFTADDNWLVETKQVKKLRIGYADGGNYAFAYFIFVDGSKLVKNFQTINLILKLMELLELSLGDQVKRRELFHERQIPIRPWDEKTVEQLYLKEVHKEYVKIHASLISNLSGLFSESVAIIDVGCGNGSLSRRLSRHIRSLPGSHVKPRFIGFDGNDGNIAECLKKLPQYKDSYASCGFYHSKYENLSQNFPKMLKVHSIEQKKDEKTSKLVGLSSGSLTRGVLSTGFAALPVWQLLSLFNIDLLIGDGLDKPLINSFMAKCLGYHPIKHNYYRYSFAYERIPSTEVEVRKQSEINQGYLDLSMHPDPESLLSKLKVSDDITLDLSFCSLSSKLIDFLLKHQNLKLIFWHWDITEINQFIYNFSVRNSYRITTNLVDDDIYLMAPKDFFLHVASENKGVIGLRALLADQDEKISQNEALRRLVKDRIEKSKPLSSEIIRDYVANMRSDSSNNEDKHSSRSVALNSVKRELQSLSESSLRYFLQLDFLALKIMGSSESEFGNYFSKLKNLINDAYEATQTKKMEEVYKKLNSEFDAFNKIKLLHRSVLVQENKGTTAILPLLKMLRTQIEQGSLSLSSFLGDLCTNFENSHRTILLLQKTTHELTLLDSKGDSQERNNAITWLRAQNTQALDSKELSDDINSRALQIQNCLNLIDNLDKLSLKISALENGDKIPALMEQVNQVYTEISTSYPQANLNYKEVSYKYDETVKEGISRLSISMEDFASELVLYESPESSPHSQPLNSSTSNSSSSSSSSMGAGIFTVDLSPQTTTTTTTTTSSTTTTSGQGFRFNP